MRFKVASYWARIYLHPECYAQADVLRAVLSGFYEAHDEGDDRVSHVRSAVQQTQMQLHVLALSLIVAGYSLTPLQTDALISTFKMTHAKLVKLFR